MRLSLFSILIFSLTAVIFVGCGPSGHTARQCVGVPDCMAGEACVQGVCRTSQVQGSCTTSADCVKGSCIAQRCSTTPSQPSDAGPVDGPDTKPNDAGPDDNPQDTTIKPPPKPTVKGNTTTVPQGKCITSSIRRCQYKQNSRAPKACLTGIQQCLFDGTWSPCQPDRENRLNRSAWVTPSQSQGERCGDSIDNNCNGLVDEGCIDVFEDSCQKLYQVRHSESNGDLDLHPAFLSSQTYSPTRKILLQRSDNNRILSLYRVNETNRTKQWLMDLPEPGNEIASYDVSKDGTRILMATTAQLFLIIVTYDEQNTPRIERYASFAIPMGDIALVGLRAAGDILVVYHRTGKGRDAEHRLSSWQLMQDANGRLSLAARGNVALPKLRDSSAGYFSFSSQKRLVIHPNGRHVIFFVAVQLAMYSLPNLKLDKFIQLDPQLIELSPRRVAFHPTKPWLVLSPFNYKSAVTTLDISTAADGTPKGTPLNVYEGHFGEYTHFGFDPGTSELYGKDDRTLMKWPTPKRGGVSSPKDLRAEGRAFAMNQQGSLLFVGSTGGIVRIIAPDSGKELYRWSVIEKAAFRFAFPRTLRLSPDGTLLFIQYVNQFELWKIRRRGGTFEATLHQKLHNSKQTIKNNEAAFSADGTWLAAAINKFIHVWKRDAQGTYRSFVVHSNDGDVSALALHPWLPYMLSGSTGGQFRLWNLEKSAETQRLASFREGKVIGATFFEVDTGKEVTLLATTQAGRTHSFSFGVVQGKAVTQQHPTRLNSSKDKVSRVFYQSNGIAVLLTETTNLLIRDGFAYTAPDQQGNRTFKNNEPYQEMTLPEGRGFSWQQGFASRSRRTFLVDKQNIYAWGCGR